MQRSIFIMIALGRCLAERRIQGNAHLLETRVESTSLEASADPKAIRISATGIHRPDGGIADDVTLNWIVGSILGLGNARPVAIELNPEIQKDLEVLVGRMSAVTSPLQIANIIQSFVSERGLKSDVPIEGFPEGVDGDPMSIEEILAGGHISPTLVDITGQAVDDAVIFPAQYGSPDIRTEGWYWSATVDTNKVGLHRCDLHFVMHRPRLEGSTVVWDPETHILEMELDVSFITQMNGFTGAGIGCLPLVEPRLVEANHV